MLRALFLEDDLSFREPITRSLLRKDIEVTEVSNLREFELKMEEIHFDLAVMRKNILGQNSLEIIENFRKISSKTLIILLGVPNSPEGRIAAYQAGADQVLEEPVQKELLLAMINSSIKRVELTQQA